jgi:hypothetical protein
MHFQRKRERKIHTRANRIGDRNDVYGLSNTGRPIVLDRRERVQGGYA